MVLRFILGLLCLSTIASATLNDVDKQFLVAKNILNNGGFENGKAAWDLQNNGGLTIVTSGSNLLTGKASGTWDASTINGLLGDNTTVPRGLYGKNGVAFCKFQVPSGTATHTLQVKYGGSPLVSQTITSSATPTYTFVNFVFPSDTSVQLAIVSTAADEPMIVIDDCFMGDASEVNLTNISQAQFIGSGYFATTANCTFTRTSTTLGALSDTDCPGATVESNPGPGTIQTTDYDAPKFAVNNLPPGVYEVCFQGATTGNAQFAAIAINDGTTTAGQSGSGSDTTAEQFRVCALFTYTSSGNRTFEIFVSSAASAYNIYNATANNQTSFSIKRFPLSSEQAYRPDAIAFNWSGFHSNDCSFTRSSSSYGQYTGDASCTFTEQANSNMGTVTSTYNGALSLTPGISFQTTRATTYHVCANANYDADGNNVNLQMIEKTSGVTIVSGVYQQVTSGQFINMQMCGNLDVDSVQTTSIEIQCKAASGACALTPNGTSGDKTVQWSIFGISQQIPAPLLVNSVVNPRSGVTNVVSASFTYSAGTPSVEREDGDWISSIADTGAGHITINVNSGTFSSTPNCTCSVQNQTAANLRGCGIISATSTTIQIGTQNYGGTAADYNSVLVCVGPK